MTMHPELVYFLKQLINGLSVGGMYAVIAIGYSMVYSILYMMNFAHGDIYIFGTFIAMALLASSLPPWLAILLAAVFGGVIAMTVERTVYRPVRHANRIVPMISALGAALVLRTVAQVIWGPQQIVYPSIIPENVIQLGDFQILSQNILSIAVAGACVLLFTILIKFTKIGKATQCAVSYTHLW